jgi:hypothetical protein
MFKYPANSAILNEARMYALESISHTFDYNGWQDGHQKMQRITTGKYAQLWLAEFCRINEIDYKKDISSPYIYDDEDLKICNLSIDCKVSIYDYLVGQVSPHCLKQENISGYAFFLTDSSLSFIKPYGFIKRDDFIKNAVCIEKGEKIFDTGITQRFSKSYFIDKKHLHNFHDVMEKFLNMSKI